MCERPRRRNRFGAGAPAAIGARAARYAPRHSADLEFLAPVLEILETPASPVRIAFLWTICALVVACLGLAYFGRIDIIASAQGKFQPTGRVKVIEPVETGRVVAIHVGNDSAVKAGDALIELDPSAAEADAKEARADLAAAEAESVRRREALAAARAHAYAPSPAIAWPEEIDSSLRAREQRVLAADLGQLAATVASFDAQKTQKIAERDMLTQTIATQKNLVATLQERVDMRTKLVEVPVGRQIRGHRRDRDAAVPADAARHAAGSARFGLDRPRCHRARLGKGGAVVPFRSGPEARRLRAAG